MHAGNAAKHRQGHDDNSARSRRSKEKVCYRTLSIPAVYERSILRRPPTATAAAALWRAGAGLSQAAEEIPEPHGMFATMGAMGAGGEWPADSRAVAVPPVHA